MQCLIVAAGKGLRLKSRGDSKPLVTLAGKPLIAHVMENAIAANVKDFVVVTGYEATLLSAFLKDFAGHNGVNIRTVYNPDYEKPNGLSVVAAREALGPRFLLSMCDHLMDPGMVKAMAGETLDEGAAMLGIDQNLDNPLVDLEDVTRVKVNEGRIEAIGKGIDDYNAYDTGLFLCSHGLLDAILESGEENDDFSISGGMMKLAATGNALTHDLSGHAWIDVDSPEMFALAEQHLKEKRS